MKKVSEMAGISRAYVYRLISEGRFPKQVTIVEGGTARAFVESEIQEWINARIEARNMEVA
jgi:prophage regulatory protein